MYLTIRELYNIVESLPDEANASCSNTERDRRCFLRRVKISAESYVANNIRPEWIGLQFKLDTGVVSEQKYQYGGLEFLRK